MLWRMPCPDLVIIEPQRRPLYVGSVDTLPQNHLWYLLKVHIPGPQVTLTPDKLSKPPFQKAILLTRKVPGFHSFTLGFGPPLPTLVIRPSPSSFSWREARHSFTVPFCTSAPLCCKPACFNYYFTIDLPSLPPISQGDFLYIFLILIALLPP